MARLYPMFVDVADRDVVVVGGGSVAHRKVKLLHECGARVTVVSPELTDGLAEIEAKGQVKVLRREYRPGDLVGVWLVIVACGVEDVSRAVRSEADAARIWCNVVDEPAQCSFHVPAAVRRGLLQIAVSTGGASPALAKRLRVELERSYGPCYERLLAALAVLRDEVKRKYPADAIKRTEIMTGFVDSGAVEALCQGDQAGFERLLAQWRQR